MRACIALVLIALVAVSSQAQLVPLWRRNHVLPDGSRFSTKESLFADDGSAYSTVRNFGGPEFLSGFKLLKRSPLGDIEWVWRFPKVPYAYGHCIASDRDGNLIVSGYYWDDHIQRGALVAKFAPTGVLQWLRRIYYPPPAGISQAYGDAVGTDSSNNVYVTLYLTGTGNPLGLAKISPSGEVLWTQSYPSTFELVDADAIFTDDAGNSTIVARAQSYPQPSDILIAKYSTDGALLWSRVYSGREGGNDAVSNQSAARIGSDGNLYVLVTCSPSNSAGYLGSIAILKYSPEGNLIWECRPPQLQLGLGAWRGTQLLLDEETNRLYAKAGWGGEAIVCAAMDSGEVLWHRTLEPVEETRVGSSFILLDRWGRLYGDLSEGVPSQGGSDTIWLRSYIIRYARDGEVDWRYRTDTQTTNIRHITDDRIYLTQYRNDEGAASSAYAVLASRGEGDVTGDGTVDDEDLTLIFERFGTSDPAADVNGDGIVYKEDLEIAATYYGLGYDMNGGPGRGHGAKVG